MHDVKNKNKNTQTKPKNTQNNGIKVENEQIMAEHFHTSRSLLLASISINAVTLREASDLKSYKETGPMPNCQ